MFIVTSYKFLNLVNLLFLQFEDGLEDRNKPGPLLGPSQSQELQDDILDIFQVLYVFMSLLRPLVCSDFLLKDFCQLLQS